MQIQSSKTLKSDSTIAMSALSRFHYSITITCFMLNPKTAVSHPCIKSQSHLTTPRKLLTPPPSTKSHTTKTLNPWRKYSSDQSPKNLARPKKETAGSPAGRIILYKGSVHTPSQPYHEGFSVRTYTMYVLTRNRKWVFRFLHPYIRAHYHRTSSTYAHVCT
jgi:hypothetical protein